MLISVVSLTQQIKTNIMKNYIALSFNTTTNEAEEVYVMANNLKEAKAKVINCISICVLGKGNSKINL
jgi:hypothetical protein